MHNASFVLVPASEDLAMRRTAQVIAAVCALFSTRRSSHVASEELEHQSVLVADPDPTSPIDERRQRQHQQAGTLRTEVSVDEKILGQDDGLAMKFVDGIYEGQYYEEINESLDVDDERSPDEEHELDGEKDWYEWDQLIEVNIEPEVFYQRIPYTFDRTHANVFTRSLRPEGRRTLKGKKSSRSSSSQSSASSPRSSLSSVKASPFPRRPGIFNNRRRRQRRQPTTAPVRSPTSIVNFSGSKSKDKTSKSKKKDLDSTSKDKSKGKKSKSSSSDASDVTSSRQSKSSKSKKKKGKKEINTTTKSSSVDPVAPITRQPISFPRPSVPTATSDPPTGAPSTITAAPVTSPTDTITDPPSTPPISNAGDPMSACFQTATFEFLQFPAINGSATSADPQTLGTIFVYNDALVNISTLIDIPQAFATGFCVRTQSREDLGTGMFVSGGGNCQLTYSVPFNGSVATFNAAGELFDSFGGNLPITGGTSDFTGATGSVNLQPILISSTGMFSSATGDVFTSPDAYRANATVIQNICLPQI